MTCEVPFVISDLFEVQTSAAYVLSCGLPDGHDGSHMAFGEASRPGEQTEWRVEWSTLVLGG